MTVPFYIRVIPFIVWGVLQYALRVYMFSGAISVDDKLDVAIGWAFSMWAAAVLTLTLGLVAELLHWLVFGKGIS